MDEETRESSSSPAGSRDPWPSENHPGHHNLPRSSLWHCLAPPRCKTDNLSLLWLGVCSQVEPWACAPDQRLLRLLPPLPQFPPFCSSLLCDSRDPLIPAASLDRPKKSAWFTPAWCQTAHPSGSPWRSSKKPELHWHGASWRKFADGPDACPSGISLVRAMHSLSPRGAGRTALHHRVLLPLLPRQRGRRPPQPPASPGSRKRHFPNPQLPGGVDGNMDWLWLPTTWNVPCSSPAWERLGIRAMSLIPCRELSCSTMSEQCWGMCEDSHKNIHNIMRLPFVMRPWEKLVAGERFSPAMEWLQAVMWGCQKSSSVLNPFDGSPAERRDDISSLMELN